MPTKAMPKPTRRAETSDTMAAYLADASKAADREPVFDPELGLAVEALPPGYDIGKLWSA